MMNNFDIMIPGASESGRLSVTSPWNGEVIGSVPVINSKAAEHALRISSSIFQNRKKWLSESQRIDILKRTAGIMETMAEMLADEAAREGGKPLADSRVEVARAIDGVLNAIDLLKSQAGKGIPMNINAASEKRLAFTTHE
ncbi:MAG: aldehyde dehydrogenase family protein, partial [Gammaproteobacteria bacterium]|nr:aldehyde dehydrogenase family protein [Gammaproteobacteria bacterium]